MTLIQAPTKSTTLEATLDSARRSIEVASNELAEARKRRDAISAALRKEFPGSRTYVNGSIAHGDALTPLTDVDQGVVIPDPDNIYGPGRFGPTRLEERAAEAIRVALKPDYGDLTVEVKGRKRSILIRFRDPVTPGQPDFTADVIVAIDNPGGQGLFIPRYTGWDRSHPEAHTRMVRQAVKDTDVMYARIVRLLKHWNRSNGKPLCSWNIKALALGCITSPVGLVEGLQLWFAYAADQLNDGETEDPARVAPHPIKLNNPRPEVVRQMRRALDTLLYAIKLADQGYEILALDQLADLFNDENMLPHPTRSAVMRQQADRIKDQGSNAGSSFGSPALIPSTNSLRERVGTRSWAV
uniref:nucleotidyltransferase n=1 Tax=Arthrobacter sp. TaxID=1667 RepID=UPI000EB6809F|nr:nucleotidyltransferase [Arthrobacter sp.]AXV46178.1 nucleotidyltransferase [Arthrobacter sp.]